MKFCGCICYGFSSLQTWKNVFSEYQAQLLKQTINYSGNKCQRLTKNKPYDNEVGNDKKKKSPKPTTSHATTLPGIKNH